MIRLALGLTVWGVLLTAGAASAAAHSFTTLLVAPAAGEQAEVGKQALDGFLYATRERDAHANETADGHLGGMDVYVRRVEPAAVASMAAEADEVEAAAGFLDADLSRRLAPLLGGRVAVVLDLDNFPPADPTDMDGRPFADVFEQAYGYAPTGAAVAGYRAARAIDRAVRAVGGDFSQVEAFNAALN